MREPIPLSRRKADWPILAFFWINLIFITYLIDIEQLVIPDTSVVSEPDFEYPVWPPKPLVELMHWFGNNHDPLLMARPMWWRMTIWIDAIFFGPFYVFGIYAFTAGKEWIRIPSIIYASVMLTNVTIILGEEFNGPHASPNAVNVVAANALWILVPVYIIYRMWTHEHPFSRRFMADTGTMRTAREVEF